MMRLCTKGTTRNGNAGRVKQNQAEDIWGGWDEGKTKFAPLLRRLVANFKGTMYQVRMVANRRLVGSESIAFD